ncbi:MAG: phosphate acyltransferase PlsX [Actinomycetia bacterium]|nr:phosphate acyltransferase PlsX [Actinomycetes bacterium]
MRIALDAMGGDLAPAAPVQGALEALRADPDLEVILVGPPATLETALDGVGPERARLTIHPAEQVIGAGEPPVAAVRAKPHASLVETIRLVKAGRADGAVSAGNTGAMMTAGLLILGRVPGVDRPALSAVLPTRTGQGVLLLDVGANIEARPLHLIQYAWMGALYAEQVLGWSRPRVALLNIGQEPAKGPAALQEVHARLAREPQLRFVGNVEARDLLRGEVDVVVADGFVGNVTLKAVEGTAETVMAEVRTALTESLAARLGGLLALPALRRLRRRLDYQEVGGVPLLGLDGVVIKAHGASRPRAFANSIRRALEQAERNVNRLISQALASAAGEEGPR